MLEKIGSECSNSSTRPLVGIYRLGSQYCELGGRAKARQLLLEEGVDAKGKPAVWALDLTMLRGLLDNADVALVNLGIHWHLHQQRHYRRSLEVRLRRQPLLSAALRAM